MAVTQYQLHAVLDCPHQKVPPDPAPRAVHKELKALACAFGVTFHPVEYEACEKAR
jgi:hypothetical protein